MSEHSEAARAQIHKAVAATREDEMAEAVLISAVVVAEWIAPDGERWISRIATTDGGERTPPLWTAEGLLHHALYGDWSDE